MTSFAAPLSTQVILEALEGFVDPPVASIVVYLGLEVAEREEPPRGKVELMEFVRGPLYQVLKKKLDDETSAKAVDSILAAIEDAAAGDTRAFGGRTMEVSIADGPVRVLVCSTNRVLPVRLRAALGPERVTVANAVDVPTAQSLVEDIRPLVVIVDAAAPPSTAEGPMADLVRALPASCTLLLWGRELEWGKALAGALTQSEVEFTPVERVEGVEPLLDLIRSRG
jgi:hypothetical protein